MPFEDEFKQSLPSVNEASFMDHALAAFRFQATHNDVYRRYLQHLQVSCVNVKKIEDIPFLPITFYKRHCIQSGNWQAELIFKSSGTSGQTRSVNRLRDAGLYRQLAIKTFESHFGSLTAYSLYALLPSYLEQGHSSLVYMVDAFLARTTKGGFYLKAGRHWLQELDQQKQPLLFGVSYALLDLVEDISKPFENLTVIDTGGMKGRKKELTRQALHEQLSKLTRKPIYSEYGMTELMTQAYGAEGKLRYPPWARAYIREVNDPLSLHPEGVGVLNVVDLANIDTCCFVATDDLARVSGTCFEILGRTDHSDIRGCNLMAI